MYLPIEQGIGTDSLRGTGIRVLEFRGGNGVSTEITNTKITEVMDPIWNLLLLLPISYVTLEEVKSENLMYSLVADPDRTKKVPYVCIEYTLRSTCDMEHE